MSSPPSDLVAVRAESRRFVPPLLFLPGLWTDAAVWRAPMSLLAQRGWDCFALQLPPSPLAWPTWRARVADAVSSFAAAPVVVGHDAGALLALDVAEGVVARVGLAPFPARAYSSGGAAPLPLWRMRWAAWRGAALERPAVLAGVDEPPGGWRAAPAPWVVGALAWQAASAASVAPGLLVVGEDDVLFPAAAVAPLAAACGCSVLRLPGAGYGMPWARGWDRHFGRVHRWLVQALGADALLEEDEDEGR